MAEARIAVCSWSLGKVGVGDLVERLARMGLDAIQLALGPFAAEPPASGGGIETLRAAGITIVSGMMAMAGEDYATLESIARTGGVRPDATWPANRRHAAAVADVAARHGIGLVTFHAGFLPEDPRDRERAKLLERLRVVADLFADRTVALALETGQETAATLESALDELDRANVGVNFDPANMILYGKGDPVAALRRLAPRVRQVHVKDALPAETPGTWGREVPVGRGAVDWPAFFEVALAIEPPVDFVIEREAGPDRIDDIVAARDLVARHVGSVRGGVA